MLLLFFFSSSFFVPDGGPTGSGGPELRRKSASSLVAVRFARMSATTGARAATRGLWVRVVSPSLEVGKPMGGAAPLPVPFPVPLLRVAVAEDESEEFEPFARALAAAMVSWLSTKGWGLPADGADGGSISLRKSMRLSCLGAGALFDTGRAVN